MTTIIRNLSSPLCESWWTTTTTITAPIWCVVATANIDQDSRYNEPSGCSDPRHSGLHLVAPLLAEDSVFL